MNRTYNTFVDNGIFVAAKLLGIPIEKLDSVDVKTKKKVFSNALIQGLEYNKNVKSCSEKMFTHNAFLNNNLKKGVTRIDKINSKLNLLLKSTENSESRKEHCIICGRMESITDIQATRSDIPAISAGTFRNYSNNLQYVNVCPECMVLTVLSLFNTINSGYLVQLNSDSNEVMEHWTNYKLGDFKYPEKSPGTYGYIISIIKFIINTIPDTDNKYLLFTLFLNLGQKEYYKELLISSSSVHLLYKFKYCSLLDEFLDIVPLWILAYEQPKLMDVLIKHSIDKLGNRKELLKIVNQELLEHDETTTDLIEITADKLMDIPKSLDDIKKIRSLNEFSDLLSRWSIKYKNLTEDTLFKNIDEYQTFVNMKKWKYMKNKLLMQLLILS